MWKKDDRSPDENAMVSVIQQSLGLCIHRDAGFFDDENRRGSDDGSSKTESKNLPRIQNRAVLASSVS